ncbi:MAG: hypothetical protein MZW92_50630 [Comamonadaceae bacterium]|nr:hypothetical protein [Comamonadaceae bacterium]
MQPLASLPRGLARTRVRGVLADIDDTLTTDGRLTAGGLRGAGAAAGRRAASWSRSPAGRRAGATTSRACGRWPRWSARTARSTSATTAARAGCERRYVDAGRRARGRPRRGWRRIAGADPRRGAGLRARRRPALPRGRPRDRLLRGRAARCRARRSTASSRCMRGGRRAAPRSARSTSTAGSATTTSSAMTRRLLRARRFGTDLDARARARASSPATRATTPRCSRIFPLSVGVANVRGFLDRLATPPAFVTERASGAGFVEVADRLLRL